MLNAKDRLDRRVVREAERPAILAQLAGLGSPPSRWLDGLEPAGQKVVDRIRRGGANEVESSGQLLEDHAVVGAQVEVAAEDQRRTRSPFDRCLGRLAELLLGEGAGGAGVEVGHAEPA